MIRFLSFDLWLTLIKSNPLFKKKRAEFMADNYNPNGLTSETVFKMIQDIDRTCDRHNEISGKKLPAEIMYSTIIQELGYEKESISPQLLSSVKANINELFFQHKPDVLNCNIMEMLSQLKSEGFSLNISSNTGFIEGLYLQRMLKIMDLDEYFNFAIYSDEINASKPSSAFFENVFANINGEKHEVLHIGDNYKADFEGALNFGFNALHIENREYSVETIKRKIHEEN